jgi:hypothetical protein
MQHIDNLKNQKKMETNSDYLEELTLQEIEMIEGGGISELGYWIMYGVGYLFAQPARVQELGGLSYVQMYN